MNVALSSANVNQFLGAEGRASVILEAAKGCQILLLQEVKYDDVAAILGEEWHVHQDRSTEARAGVAVAWRKELGEAKKVGLRIACRATGVEMLDRYIAFVDLVIDGALIRFASTHRPPARYAHLWFKFDRTVKAFRVNSPVPVVLGIDGNKKLGVLAKALGFNSRGKGIVGFLNDKRLKTSPPIYRRTRSDHPAVTITVKLAICPCCGRKLTITGK